MKIEAQTRGTEWWRPIESIANLFGNTVLNVTKMMIDPIARWVRRQKAAAELKALNDHMLRDIGIGHWQIKEIAASSLSDLQSEKQSTDRSPAASANDNALNIKAAPRKSEALRPREAA